MPGVMKYINRISRASAVVYSHQLQEEGIAQCHHPYILLICREPGISQERIAKEICVNRSNVTRQLTVLEKKGLIERGQDKQDRRVWRVYPTEKMKRLLPIVRQVMGNWNDYLMADLKDEEKEQLLIILDKLLIRANLAAEKQISFDTEDYIKRGNEKMKSLFPYIKPKIPRMLFGLSIKFSGTITDLLIPWMLSHILDVIVPQKNIKLVLFWGVLMMVAAGFVWITNITANRMASGVAREITRAVRHDLFYKISSLSCKQIDDYSISTLESRLTTDTYNVNQFVNVMQRMGVRQPILLLGGICITLALEPVLALVMIAVLPLIAFVVFFVSSRGIPLYKDLQKGVDHMVRHVRESISGIRIIKALSKTEQEKEKFSKVNQEVVLRESKAALTMGITNPMMNLLLNLGMMLVILIGAYRVNSGVTKPGTIIAFLSYFTIILNAMLAINRIFIMYSKGSASAQRIGEILNLPEDLMLTDEEIVNEEEHIVFDDVSFSYLGKTDNLSHISFRLKKGETLGIIGSTGAGKTTIINLLMRLYEKSSGSIRINGREVSSIKPEELHTKFGVVFQNDVLFADTVYENIDFGRGLSKEKIMRAAKCAQAWDFIKALPNQMEHLITAHGTNLSGGQRQRVLLSRALAGDSEIIILDDSSSALDYKTDAMLRQALRENYQNITTIVIAQRVSSILHADHILVLDEGKEIGYGTHEELLKNCAIYKEISDSQMGGDFE